MTLTEKLLEAEKRTIAWACGENVEWPDCGERKSPVALLIYDFIREYQARELLIEIKGVVVKDKKYGNKIKWKKI